MKDDEIGDRIRRLIDEEHQLREAPPEDPGVRRARLADLEASLDQCWDLLRQRQALREAGEDPGRAQVRPARTVESYEQ